MNRIFEKPFFYELNQKNLLTIRLRRKIESFLTQEITGTENYKALDIGCGTGQYMKTIETECFGTDINIEYLKYIRVVYNFSNIFSSDSAFLPVKDNSFGFIFSINVFHHLEDWKVKAVLHEMWRVCIDGGKVFVIDVVYPPSRIKNIIGWLLRRFDRGKFMREREYLKSIFIEFFREVEGSLRFIDFKAYPHDAAIAIIQKKDNKEI